MMFDARHILTCGCCNDGRDVVYCDKCNAVSCVFCLPDSLTAQAMTPDGSIIPIEVSTPVCVALGLKCNKEEEE